MTNTHFKLLEHPLLSLVGKMRECGIHIPSLKLPCGNRENRTTAFSWESFLLLILFFIFWIELMRILWTPPFQSLLSGLSHLMTWLVTYEMHLVGFSRDCNYRYHYWCTEVLIVTATRFVTSSHVPNQRKIYVHVHHRYLEKKRPFLWRGDAEIGEGMLLLPKSLNFLIPTSLQSSGSATITSGCLPIWNLQIKLQNTIS